MMTRHRAAIQGEFTPKDECEEAFVSFLRYNENYRELIRNPLFPPG